MNAVGHEVERGWKTWAERLALGIREEIGTTPHDRVDLMAVADAYGVPVYLLSGLVDYGCSPKALTHLSGPGGTQFSAALVPDGRRQCIVVNDFHASTRQRSSLAHELAHVLLEHEFPASILGVDKCRLVDKTIEDKADWFARELLLPTVAAKRLAAFRVSDEGVAAKHGLSNSLAAMRMNATGARKIAQRAAQKKATRARGG